MYPISLNIIFFTLLLGFTACSKRVCTEKNIYNGLYNALTCDYEEYMKVFENNTSKEELKYFEGIGNYESLKSKVIHKEHRLMEYQSHIEATEILIYDIEKNLNEIDTKEEIKPLLKGISEHISKQYESRREQY